MSIDILCEKIIKKQNPTVLGLDPLLSYIPESILENAKAGNKNLFEAAADAIFQFNKGLIDATCEIIPAVKPQAAYYELYGPEGMAAYKKTIGYAKEKGLYVIADVKRGDIGSTAAAYAKAYLGKTELFGESESAFDCDCCTVSPYLGSDGIIPFIDICKEENKSIFMLVKTSNDSSGELQDLSADGQSIYKKMAVLAEKLGEGTTGKYGYSACGAVVGATYPAQLRELRSFAPHTFFLVPGYGAQGAGASDVAGGFDSRGLGAIVNSSRGIICAYKAAGMSAENYKEAAAGEAENMKKALLGAVGGKIG